MQKFQLVSQIRMGDKWENWDLELGSSDFEDCMFNHQPVLFELCYIALGFYSYALQAALKEGAGEGSDEGETNSMKLWVPEGHFNQNIYAFISFINGGSTEDFSGASGWNMLETTALLHTDIQVKLLCHKSFLSHLF